LNSINFVKELRRFVIDFDHIQYRKQLEESEIGEIKDEYWLSVVKFYQNLDAESQKIFFSILRQIKVDNTSLILGILDGNMILENQEKDFFLAFEGSKKPLNGELQEVFLELEEEADPNNMNT